MKATLPALVFFMIYGCLPGILTAARELFTKPGNLPRYRGVYPVRCHQMLLPAAARNG